MDSPLFQEMANVGISGNGIITFTILGIGMWSVLTWLFVKRYQELHSSTSTADDEIKNLSIIILSFHVATLALTIGELYMMNYTIWYSWFVIALALSATFLNVAYVGLILSNNSDSTPYGLGEYSKQEAISSLVIQVFANSLMTAYIFKIIRSKRKIQY